MSIRDLGDKYDIHVKGGFSERKGLKSISDIVQTESLNMRTRNRIYNTTLEYVFGVDSNLRDSVIEYLYVDVFSKTIDEVPMFPEEAYATLKDIFQTVDYNEVFDTIDGIISAINYAEYYDYQKKEYIKNINGIFKEENVNYKIVNDEVVDIIDDIQIESIEKTLQNEYKTVATHYSKAIEQLYKVKDYDNSIKESISTVESMCQILTKNDKATLGDALKLLKDIIHPAMKSDFEKLYGYTSDANGIRHANGLGEGNSTFEEAKYMLISCSAFVNYLRENFENKED